MNPRPPSSPPSSPPPSPPEESTNRLLSHCIFSLNYVFLLAFKEAFARRWDYKGRSTRAEVWSAFPLIPLPSFIIVMALMIIISLIMILSIFVESIFYNVDTILVVISSIAILVSSYYLIIITLSLSVRRLHDIGHSGWIVGVSFILWLFLTICNALDASLEIFNHLPSSIAIIMNMISMISIIVFIFVFILMLRDSQRGSNKWGHSTKYPQKP